MCGNTCYLSEDQWGSREEFSFLFKSHKSLESVYPEKGKHGSKKHPSFWVSGALSMILEKERTRFIRPLDVPITAAGLQGSQPLVIRIMWVREVGKFGP